MEEDEAVKGGLDWSSNALTEVVEALPAASVAAKARSESGQLRCRRCRRSTSSRRDFRIGMLSFLFRRMKDKVSA